MKALVAGGAGFIGSNFVRYLTKAHPEYEIVVLDKLTYAGRKENLQDVIERITFVKGDIQKRDVVLEAMKDCDLVVNFAAETHVDRSIGDSGAFVLTNVIGTYNLLEAARQLDVSRFEQISTDEVYGHIKNGSFREENKLNPRNPYAASKAGAEHFCGAYHQTYGLPVVTTRSSNNYGPYQHPEKLIPKAITYAAMGRSIPVYGRGENVRDWLHVEDNCRAIDTVLHKGEAGEVYNIAGHNELRNIEIVKIILQLSEKPESLIQFVKDRPGHDVRYSLNTHKIQSLGWKPQIEFERGIKNTVEWYHKNAQWWKSTVKDKRLDFHD